MPTDIRFETSAGMAWAILDRPESLNALTLAMIDRLASWLDDTRKDKDISSVGIRAVPGSAY